MSAPTIPTRRSIRAGVSSFLLAMGAAQECAAAIESGRTPSRRALSVIGIDADAWSRIGKR